MIFEAYDEYGDKILNTPTSDLKRIYRDGKKLRIETKDEFVYKGKDGELHKVQGPLEVTVLETNTENEARRMLKATQRMLELFKGVNVKGAKE